MKNKNKNNGLYSIIGRFYDILDYPSELMYYRSMRKKWIAGIKNEEVLEIGVGTGKNLLYYHYSNNVIGLDRVQSMLVHAAQRIKKKKVQANASLTLQRELPWKLSRKKFSQIVATFVFCTMPNPKPVLEELTKWVSKGTKLLIFEYVRPTNRRAQAIVDSINPIIVKLFGVDLTRKPTHEFFDNNWKITRRTDIVKDLIIVVEAIKT